MGDGVVVGVDGCPAGWVAAAVSGGAVTWSLHPDAASVVALPAAAVAVDIPIGLPSGRRRDCDVAASRLLRGGGSSRVFPTPPRPVTAATSYAEACALSLADCGKSLSRQTFAIWPKVMDFEECAFGHERVVEAHPEVSFFLMATERLLPSKHSLDGLDQRRALLEEHLDADVAAALRSVPRGAKADDALDALACAWTAGRWLRGEAVVLGGETDATGRPMRIVA